MFIQRANVFALSPPTGIQQSESVAVVPAGPRQLLPLPPELGQVALLPLLRPLRLALPGLRRRRVRVRQPRGGGGHARHLARPAATWTPDKGVKGAIKDSL